MPREYAARPYTSMILFLALEQELLVIYSMLYERVIGYMHEKGVAIATPLFKCCEPVL